MLRAAVSSKKSGPMPICAPSSRHTMSRSCDRNTVFTENTRVPPRSIAMEAFAGWKASIGETRL